MTPDLSRRAEASVVPARLLFALAFLVAAAEGYDVQIIGVVGKTLVRDFALTPWSTSLVFGSAMVGLFVGGLSGGLVAEHFGVRPTLAAAAALFGLCTLATALAHDTETLICARLATGLGIGAAMPCTIALTAALGPDASRTRRISIMSCGLPIGAAVASIAAASAQVPWQDLFVRCGVAALLLAALIAASTLIPIDEIARVPNRNHLRHVSAGEALFGDDRWSRTLFLWVTFILTLLILYLLLNWLPLLVVGKGQTGRTGAIAASAFNLSALGGAPVLGFACDRIGARLALSLAYIGLALAMLALAAVSTPAGIIAASGGAGFCLAGALFSLYGVVPSLYPAGGRNVGIGVAVGVGRLGSIAGPIVAGAMLVHGTSASGIALMMVPLALTALIFLIATSLTGPPANVWSRSP